MTCKDSPEEKAGLEQITELMRSNGGLYPSLFENAGVGITYILEGRFIQANGYFLDFIGYEMDELRHMSPLDITHPDDIEKSHEILQGWDVCGKEIRHLEKRYLHKNGSIRWGALSTSPLCDQRGNVVALMGVVVDITECKEAEAALNRSEERLMQFFHASFETIFFHDHGTIIDVNPAATGIFGYPTEQIIGHNLLEFVAPESREHVISNMQAGDEGPYETEVFKSDGSIIPLEVRAKTIEHDGHVCRVVGLRDISERKAAEAAIRRAHDELEIRVQERTAELSKANRAYKLLSDCNATLVHATEETGLLEEMCRRFVENGDYRLVWIGYAQDDDEKSVRPAAQAGSDEGYLAGLNITWANDERGQGPTGTAIRTGMPVVNKDVRTNSAFAPWRDNAIQRGYASSIALPLITGERTIGALNIYASSPDAFDSEEIELLMDLAGNLAFGIESLRTRDEHRQAEAARRNSEDRFRNLIETTSDWVWEIDENSVYTYASPQVYNILGYRPEEVLGQTPFDLMPVDEAERVAAVFAPIAAVHGPFYCLENTNQHKDGQLVVLESCGLPVFDGNGKFSGYRGIDRDITERKRANKELQRLSTAVQQSPASIVITDPMGNIEYVNPKFTEITGYSAAEVLGLNPRILKSGYHTAEFYQNLWETITSGEVWSGEFRNRKKSGELFWENASISPILNEKGEISSFVTVKEDITERKQAEDVARQHLAELAHVSRLSTMGEMATGMAHELNQPLAAIKAFADAGLQLLHEENADSALMARALVGVSEQAMRAGEIIRRLRGFVKKEDLQKKPVDLNALVEEVVALTKAEAIKHDVKIRLQLTRQLPQITASAIEIQQVLVNLIHNGIEAMCECSELPAELIISTYPANQKAVAVAVSDTGPGMDQAVLEQIFEPFFTTKGSNGIGVGLSISRSIIEAHGGTLTADSEPGRGTRFVFTLPLEVIEE